jgi:hypothetical protein
VTDRPDNDDRDGGDSGTRLVIHLYRQYELPVTYAARTTRMSGAMQARLMGQIQECQADFLSRLGQLRHNVTNYVRRIASRNERVNHRGIYLHSVGWYRDHRPEVYQRFKRLLLDIRDLLPALPPSPLAGLDPVIAAELRTFERESEAVIVQPVRDMALKVLTHTLVGEGLLTEQAMLVHFDLRDDDFSRAGFARTIARVIHDRNSLYFRQRVQDSLLAGNINVLQGQLDGHGSHLMNLLTRSDLSAHVQATLQRIRRRHLPVILTQVLQELERLEEVRPESRGPHRVKDRLVEALVIRPAALAEAVTTLGCLGPGESASPDPADDELNAALRHLAGALRQVGGATGRHVELTVVVRALRRAIEQSLQQSLDLLHALRRLEERVEGAVGPLLGLISFESGGQSEFYARWFPGLQSLRERDVRLPEYVLGLRRLQASLARVDARGREVAGALSQHGAIEWTPLVEATGTPSSSGRASSDAPPTDLPIDDTAAVLGEGCALLEALARAPAWWHHLEADQWAAVDGRRTRAQQLLAACRSTESLP